MSEEQNEEIVDDKVVTPEAEAPQTEGKQYTEVEQRAMKLGWKPKDEWDGDPEDHRSAKDFLDRGEMIGKLRAQERELQQTKAAIEHLSKQQKQTYTKGYETAIADLKAQRVAALEDGDLLKAEELRDQIDVTKEQLEAVKASPNVPKASEIDPAFYTWVEANPWYQDPVMQKFADALAIEYVAVAKKEGKTINNDVVRDFVTGVVKTEFAHRFGKGERKVVGAPNPDGAGRASGKESSNTSANLQKIKAGLSEDERQIMKTILRSNKDLTESEYLKMYASAPVARY